MRVLDSNRFWARVDKRGPQVLGMRSCCWVWIGGRVRRNGVLFYGRLRWPTGSSRHAYVHRVVIELSTGRFPEGEVVLHLCDNMGCVRPSHLRVGTHADNVADKVRKGRQPRGSSHGIARLREELIPGIRAARAAGMSINKIAEKFGVSSGAIQAVIYGRTWGHV